MQTDVSLTQIGYKSASSTHKGGKSVNIAATGATHVYMYIHKYVHLSAP